MLLQVVVEVVDAAADIEHGPETGGDRVSIALTAGRGDEGNDLVGDLRHRLLCQAFKLV